MKWERWLPYWRWMMVSATFFLAVIGVNVVRLWRAGRLGDWAMFTFGLIAIVLMSVFLMTALFYRDPWSSR